MSNRMHSALRWKEITPSDTAMVEPVPVAIRCNVAGDVNISGDDGTALVFTVSAGEVLHCQPHMVMATGTTATGIRALHN